MSSYFCHTTYSRNDHKIRGMNVQIFIPQNEMLKEYIECFYILTHLQDEEIVSYLTFPSIFSIVTSVINAENIITSEHITTRYCSSKSLETSLVCRFNKPICFRYDGDVKEICIYFKPLGLNTFLEAPLETYSKSYFDKFVPYSDYETTMISILEMEDKDLLISKLEQYWLQKLIGFKHPFLFEAINKLNQNPNMTTSDLAKYCQVSQKTLIKHFKKNLCKTPSEYKKILRFRTAIEEMKRCNEELKLTTLSYIANFFDQSHMIANFKSLTGHSPKEFFKQLSTQNKSNIHWIFN